MEDPANTHGMMEAKLGDGVDPSVPFQPPGESRAFIPVIDSHHADVFIDCLGHRSYRISVR